MSRLARVLTLVASLLLVTLYVTPVWTIRLLAPQYPEGLGMTIRLNTIEGVKEHDIRNINSLNHYIGMKPIEPDAIPELRYMPWIVAGLIGGGLAAAAAGRRRLLVSWVGVLAIAGAGGLYDFWRWSYDYGHNLDFANAIIVVPGMTYQPPLIGTKQLLNFTATSLPAAGGIIAALAFLVAVSAIVVSYRRRGSQSLTTSLALILAPSCAGAGAQRTIEVRPAPAMTISAAIRLAHPGDRIVIRAGVYREPTIVIDKPLTLVGEPGAILDGTNSSDILRIEAADVTVSGLHFQNVSPSHVEDRAAIRVGEVAGCRIEDNQIDNAFFGIYLAGTTRCLIARNQLRGRRTNADGTGNGIHLWTAREITIEANRITGHRDGIYFEFVHRSVIRDNVSEKNLRYGLHFMYSDDCRYERNTFRGNGAGVAVMYTKRVTMVGNRFEDNWGSAAYGLLLKEIYDARLDSNTFSHNTTGLVADGATRLEALHNVFADNGWAVRLMASTQDATFAGNSFERNTFDVSTNSRTSSSRFSGNYWDDYRGYDLDRDGRGDVAHRPVRLFSLILERNEPTMILLRSPVIGLLDAAERLLPVLTPAVLADSSSRMRRPR